MGKKAESGDKMLAYLAANPEGWFTAAQVAEAIPLSTAQTSIHFKAMRGDGRVMVKNGRRLHSGLYIFLYRHRPQEVPNAGVQAPASE